MPVVFDTLQRASFAGFEFPCSRIEVIGGLRDHVHEYPHSPGGAPEKLGRKLYEVHVTSSFMQGFPKYPLLYPETLQSLFIIFEGGGTFDLVIPTLGTISAYCTSWRKVADPKSARNGETVELTFREDDSNLFLVDKLIAQSNAGFASAAASYANALADQRSRAADAEALLAEPDPVMLLPIPPAEDSLFNQVLAAANALQAALDTAVLVGDLIAVQAANVVSICELVDASVSIFNDPTRFPLLYAMQDVWLQAAQIASDPLRNQIRVVYYTVPAGSVMSVTDVSRALYGDNSHAIDLLQANALTDPFYIPGGTVIKAYLPADTTLAAA